MQDTTMKPSDEGADPKASQRAQKNKNTSEAVSKRTTRGSTRLMDSQSVENAKIDAENAANAENTEVYAEDTNQEVKEDRAENNENNTNQKHRDDGNNGDSSSKNVSANYGSEFEQRMEKKIEEKLDAVINVLGRKVTQKISEEVAELSQKLEAKLIEDLSDVINKKIGGEVTEINKKISTLESALNKQEKDMIKHSEMFEDLQATGNLDTLNKRLSELETTRTNTPDLAKIEERIKVLESQLEEQKCLCQASYRDSQYKIEGLEVYSRKPNLVFEGFPHQEGEDCKQIIETFVRSTLSLNMSNFIDVAHRQFAAKPGQTYDRPIPIIVRFRSLAARNRILENGSMLRDSDKAIHTHMPPSVTQRRTFLHKTLQAAKIDDPGARIIRDKLKYNGKLYTAPELSNMNVGFKDSTVTTDTHIRFYGKNSYFSNFYKSRFTMRGLSFSCVEQAFQYGRARAAGDFATANEIKCESDPAQMKRLGKRHRTQPAALDAERKLMEEAVYLKFTTNKFLAKMLTDTYPKPIYECNPYEKYFSTGVRIDDDEALATQTYPGKNYLGRILEQVRDKLRAK